MPTTRANPTDFTGRQRQDLAKEAAETTAARSKQLAMITAADDEAAQTEVTDLTGTQPTIIDSVDAVGVSLADEWEVVQVIEDLSCTIGAGNHLEFKAGRKYKVSKGIAGHLREKGYVWGS